MKIPEKIMAFQSVIATHARFTKDWWTDHIISAAEIAAQNPDRILILMREAGGDVFNLSDLSSVKFQKFFFYEGYEDAHFFLLDFSEVESIYGDYSKEVSPERAELLIRAAWSVSRVKYEE